MTCRAGNSGPTKKKSFHVRAAYVSTCHPCTTVTVVAIPRWFSPPMATSIAYRPGAMTTFQRLSRVGVQCSYRTFEQRMSLVHDRLHSDRRGPHSDPRPVRRIRRASVGGRAGRGCGCRCMVHGRDEDIPRAQGPHQTHRRSFVNVTLTEAWWVMTCVIPYPGVILSTWP